MPADGGLPLSRTLVALPPQLHGRVLIGPLGTARANLPADVLNRLRLVPGSHLYRRRYTASGIG